MDTNTGVYEGKMKFKLELNINKSPTEVWQAFTDPELTSKWQPSLAKTELLSGTQGQPGAVTKLTYEEGGREFSLIERITVRDEPHQFDVIYENEFTNNPMKNTFIAQEEDKTLWTIDAQFKFKTVLMKIIGPFMKKNFIARTQRDMERFKEFMEGLERRETDDQENSPKPDTRL